MPGTTARGVPHAIGSDEASSIDESMLSLAEWLNDNPGSATLTTAERDALSGAAVWTGRAIYNTTLARPELYNGVAWVRSGVTDHGDLAGAEDDDHAQYLNTTRHDLSARHPVSVLGSDGLGLGLRQIVKFTASSTFVPGDYPWLRAIRIRLVGGGGAGAGTPAVGAAQFSFALSGHAGGYAEALVLAGDLAASETVTVGAAGVGASGVSGGDGGTTSFGTHAAATGGDGGRAMSADSTSAIPSVYLNSGSPGTGTVGDLRFRGGDGGDAVIPGGGSIGLAAPGGASHFASGPAMVLEAVGAAGTFGAGGGGIRSYVSEPAYRGGDGGKGHIIVELYA
jgi:hypothetical protein